MSFQAYIDNIQAKTGKTPDDFRTLAAEGGLTKFGEIVAWLKADFGLGHGHANAMAQLLLNADKFKVGPGDTLASQNRESLAQIEANMRDVGRMQRLVVERPCFHIFISPQTLDHLTFATPLPGEPADWAEAVNDMVAVFREQGKRPRLEFIADLHPNLPAALEQAGLVCERRDPVMVLQTAELAPAPDPQPHLHYQRLTAENETLLRAHLTQQSIAFGGSGADEDALGWLPNLQQGLASGLVIGAVLEQATLLQQGGELLSGAVIQMGDGPGELAGVWTAPQWRGRGLAFVLCQQLLAEYAALGHTTCWLSAAEGAQRLYEKLGFVSVGTQLNYGGATATSIT